MRVALFSDVHGNVGGLRAVLAAIGDLGGADVTLCAGDMLGYGAGAEDVLDLLVERGVRMVRGNHEEMYLDDAALVRHVHPGSRPFFRATAAWLRRRLSPAHWDLLASLPLWERVEVVPARALLVCHSTPADTWSFVCSAESSGASLRRAYGDVDADVVAYGHAHRGRGADHHVRWWDGKLLLNVAGVGGRRDGLSAFTLLEYAREQWLAQQFQVPFDPAAEARLAAERGFPDH